MKPLLEQYEDAKKKYSEQYKKLVRVLEKMVEGGLAKRIEDWDEANPIIIVGPKWALDEIRYYVPEEYALEFWGVNVQELKDDLGDDFREEDIDEYTEVVVMPPNEAIEWWAV